MTTLYHEGNFNVIADAARRDEWLEARSTLLTSSDVFTFREVGLPDWWSSNRDDILKEKVLDIQKSFSQEEETSMAHGTFDEENIARKTGKALGCEVQCVNWLCVNERWGYLGASIDSFIDYRPNRDPFPVLCQDRSSVPLLREKLAAHPDPLLLEIKKSTSRSWQKYPPDYYANAQVQMQLHILDLPAAILVADTLKDVRHYDRAQKRAYYRRYWDLKPYYVERNPKWADILDEVNEEFPREWAKWEGVVDEGLLPGDE